MRSRSRSGRTQNRPQRQPKPGAAEPSPSPVPSDGLALASPSGAIPAPRGAARRRGERRHGERSGTSRAVTGVPVIDRALGMEAWHAALIIIAVGFVLRLAIFPLGNFKIDTNTLYAWANQLAHNSPRSFYAGTNLGDHLPGDLWLLWALAHVYTWFTPIGSPAAIPFLWFLKFVPAVTDAVIAVLIFVIGRRLGSPVSALVATMLWVFNPASMFVGSVWTQWDSLSAMVALIGVWLYLRGKPEWAIPVLAYGCLIKPQIAVIGLVLAVAFVLSYIAPHVAALRPVLRGDHPVETLRASLIRVGTGIVASLVVFLIICVPFNIGLIPGMGQFTIWNRISYALDVYKNTTLNAFTLWGVLSQNWGDDGKPTALGISYQATGTLLTIVALLGILWMFVRAWKRFGTQALVWALMATSFAVYLLPTRGHERYLFPTMVMAALLTAVLPRLVWIYLGLTGVMFLNVYWVYTLYENAPKLGPMHGAHFQAEMSLLATVLFAAAVLVGYALMTRGNTFTAPRWLPGWAFPDGSPHAGQRGRGPLGWRPGADYETDPLTFDRADAEATTRPRWQTWYLPLAFAILGAVFFFIRVGTPDDYIYDEVYHAFTAAQYVDGNPNTFNVFANAPADGEAGVYTWYPGDNGNRTDRNFAYEWTHPPLAKEIIAIGILLFGDNPEGWRFTSWVFGAIGLFVIYRLGMALTGRWLVGALSAGLLLLDGLYYVQSRTSMVDIHIVIFIMAALWGYLNYLRLPSGAPMRQVATTTLLTGLMMGAAAACKWNGFYPVVFMILFAFLRLAWMWLRATPTGRAPAPNAWSDLRNHVIFVPIMFVVLPLLIYFLSYFQMFLMGYSFDDWVELQRQMLYYHTVAVVGDTHNYMSVWWQWPLALMPVWYGTQNHPGTDTRGYVFTLVNPYLAWSMIPAAITVCWLWARQYTIRWQPLVVMLIGFFGQWLIWAASPRMAFQYHFLPVAVFGIIAIAALVEYGWRHREIALSGRATRIVRWAPVALVLVGIVIQIALWVGVRFPLPNGKQTPDGYHAWALYGIPIVAFGAVGVAMAIPILRRGTRTINLRAGAVTYVVVAALIFAFLFPIYAGTPLTQHGLDLRTWLPGWTVR